MQDALNNIFPPRVWNDDRTLWKQSVSAEPIAAEEVGEMVKSVDLLVKLCRGRKTGVCPIRRKIFNKLFDEVIRQVTIECVERGVLLARVRDEINMSMASYHRVYKSSVVCEMNKVVEAEDDIGMIWEQIDNLELDKEYLLEIIKDLKAERKKFERENEKRHSEKISKYSEEVAMLKEENAQLKAQLEKPISRKK